MKLNLYFNNTNEFLREIHTEIYVSSAIFISFSYIIISKITYNIFAKDSAVPKVNYNTSISSKMQFCRCYVN